MYAQAARKYTRARKCTETQPLPISQAKAKETDSHWPLLFVETTHELKHAKHCSGLLPWGPWNALLSRVVIELRCPVRPADLHCYLEIGYAISASLRAIPGYATRNEPDYRTSSHRVYSTEARCSSPLPVISRNYHPCWLTPEHQDVYATTKEFSIRYIIQLCGIHTQVYLRGVR